MGEFTKKLFAMASVLLLGGCLEALDLIAAEASGPQHVQRRMAECEYAVLKSHEAINQPASLMATAYREAPDDHQNL
jgi:hypothetical protein